MMKDRDRAGVDALALDPQDDSKVYMAVGEYTNRFVSPIEVTDPQTQVSADDHDQLGSE